MDLLDLTKALDDNLAKHGVVDIPKMEVKLAVDRSGSMHSNFRCGAVDAMVDIFIAAALKFDDNGSLEMGFFNEDMEITAPATVEDLHGYTRRHGVLPDGGTNYAPIIQKFETKGVVTGFLSRVASIFSKRETKPAFAAIITDGDNWDVSDFEVEFAKTSGDTFWLFIAIGDDVTASTLTRAAQVPHAALIRIRDPRTITPSEFYDMICNDKFVAWLNKGKA